MPTQIVSSYEYFPAAQNAKQREVEARLLDMGERLAKRQGISRRRFFQTASGMAAAFVAMNQTYGRLFAANTAEAATPELADARAAELKHQFIMDMQTHFLRDDTRLTGFVNMRQAVGKAGWNPAADHRGSRCSVAGGADQGNGCRPRHLGGPGHRNGRSKDCAGWRFPTT